MACWKEFFRSSEGATAIEYGLLAAFISMAIYAGVIAAGDGAGTMFNLIGEIVVASVANK